MSINNLPTLRLNTYEGDPAQFLSFYEVFRSVVHNIRSFDDVGCLLYLKSIFGTEPSKVTITF